MHHKIKCTTWLPSTVNNVAIPLYIKKLGIIVDW